MALGKYFSTKTTAKVPKATKKYVQKTISRNQETKRLDISYGTPVEIDTGVGSGVSFTLNAPAQGDDVDERTGNSITVTNVLIRGIIDMADVTNIVRCVVYIPKNVGDDLGSDSLEWYETIDYDKYTVLSDKLIHGVSGQDSELHTYYYSKRFNTGSRKGMNIEFAGTTGAFVSKNLLKVYMVSDSTTTAHPSFRGETRCRFKDA